MAKKIPLSGLKGKGKYALVDDDMYDYLNQWKWHINSDGYVIRTIVFPRVNGKQPSSKVWIHREINQTPDSLFTDHINQNRLDNRRKNLRVVNKSQNAMNQKTRSDNTSTYKGVHWDKSRKKWVAQIIVNRKDYFLGRFLTIQGAWLARRWGERIYHGEFSELSSKPPCVDNRSGQPLLPPSNSGK